MGNPPLRSSADAPTPAPAPAPSPAPASGEGPRAAKRQRTSPAPGQQASHHAETSQVFQQAQERAQARAPQANAQPNVLSLEKGTALGQLMMASPGQDHLSPEFLAQASKEIGAPIPQSYAASLVQNLVATGFLPQPSAPGPSVATGPNATAPDSAATLQHSAQRADAAQTNVPEETINALAKFISDSPNLDHESSSFRALAASIFQIDVSKSLIATLKQGVPAPANPPSEPDAKPSAVPGDMPPPPPRPPASLTGAAIGQQTGQFTNLANLAPGPGPFPPSNVNFDAVFASSEDYGHFVDFDADGQTFPIIPPGLTPWADQSAMNQARGGGTEERPSNQEPRPKSDDT